MERHKIVFGRDDHFSIDGRYYELDLGEDEDEIIEEGTVVFTDFQPTLYENVCNYVKEGFLKEVNFNPNELLLCSEIDWNETNSTELEKYEDQGILFLMLIDMTRPQGQESYCVIVERATGQRCEVGYEGIDRLELLKQYVQSHIWMKDTGEASVKAVDFRFEEERYFEIPDRGFNIKQQ